MFIAIFFGILEQLTYFKRSSGKSGPVEYIYLFDAVLSVASLIILTLYILKIKLFRRYFWVFAAVVLVFWDFLLNLYLNPTFFGRELDEFWIVALVLLSPLYISLFLYAKMVDR